MAKTKTDERVTKRKVTMTNVVARPSVKPGEVETLTYQAVDYVRPDHLEAYVTDARTRWQVVDVSEKPDAGPGGYEGATHVPVELDVPDAGTTYPAEES